MRLNLFKEIKLTNNNDKEPPVPPSNPYSEGLPGDDSNKGLPDGLSKIFEAIISGRAIPINIGSKEAFDSLKKKIKEGNVCSICPEDVEEKVGELSEEEHNTWMTILAQRKVLDDKAAELQQKWQVETGQVWEAGKHRIMCGSATDDADIR